MGARSKSCSIPTSSLLLHRLHPTYIPWLPAIPCTHRARADPADVRRQEHDVCVEARMRHALCGLAATALSLRDNGGGRVSRLRALSHPLMNLQLSLQLSHHPFELTATVMEVLGLNL